MVGCPSFFCEESLAPTRGARRAWHIFRVCLFSMRGCPAPHETHKGSRYISPFPAPPHRLSRGSRGSCVLVEEEGWGTQHVARPTCSINRHSTGCRGGG